MADCLARCSWFDHLGSTGIYHQGLQSVNGIHNKPEELASAGEKGSAQTINKTAILSPECTILAAVPSPPMTLVRLMRSAISPGSRPYLPSGLDLRRTTAGAPINQPLLLRFRLRLSSVALRLPGSRGGVSPVFCLVLRPASLPDEREHRYFCWSGRDVSYPVLYLATLRAGFPGLPQADVQPGAQHDPERRIVKSP